VKPASSHNQRKASLSRNNIHRNVVEHVGTGIEEKQNREEDEKDTEEVSTET
jgi:hypothetical protein